MMNVKRLSVAAGLVAIVMTPIGALAGERASEVTPASKAEMVRKTLPIKAKKKAFGLGAVGTALVIGGGVVAGAVIVSEIADDDGPNQSPGASS